MLDKILNKTNKTFFSVIISTYNRDYIINKAIKSLFLQEFDEWDLIIVDDGSSDDTKTNIISLISELKSEYPKRKLNFAVIDDLKSNELKKQKITEIDINKENNIYYYYQKNQGVTSSRNIGIEISLKFSKSEYITFLDSDDTYLPNHLSSRFKMLSEFEGAKSKLTKSIDLLHGGVKVIGNEFVPDKNDLSKMIKIEDCVVGGTFFMKKNIFGKVGFFEQVNYSDDSHFFEKVLNNNLNIKKIELPTYIYNRESVDSLCDSFV